MSKRHKALSHGHAAYGKSITYRAWDAMVQRCTNPSHKSFSVYASVPIHPGFLGPGGFEAYLAAVGPRPGRAYTLDRIAPELGYVPGNLRWACRSTQENNKARRTFYGLTVEDWARRLGVKPTTVRKRLERQWDHDRMFPVELRAA